MFYQITICDHCGGNPKENETLNQENVPIVDQNSTNATAVANEQNYVPMTNETTNLVDDELQHHQQQLEQQQQQQQQQLPQQNFVDHSGGVMGGGDSAKVVIGRADFGSGYLGPNHAARPLPEVRTS